VNTEFHYYITGMVARAAGFTEDEARTIATASEFVDENDIPFSIEDREGGKPYEVYISQTMNILKPKRKLMRIYPVFHFLPGDPTCDEACRRDGKMHLLNTTPGNDVATDLLRSAFKATDDLRLHRIGVASHAYADTWAHQNFVGWYDYFNNMGLDPKPDIGHADAEHHPDWVAHRWADDRLVNDEIDNTERYLEAAENLYNEYRNHLDPRGRDAVHPWSTVNKDLREIFGRSMSGFIEYGADDRLIQYQERASWLGEFDEDTWYNEGIVTKVHGLPDLQMGLASTFCLFKDKYYWCEGVERESTNWFRFQEAVKAHQRDAMELLKDRFDRMDIDLRQH
jgi:hypothetical protein